MAYMGRPFASYMCLSVYPERFDRLRGSVGLPVEISFLVSLPARGDASVFVPGCAIVVGHTPAMLRFTKGRSV
jgi:hypothetical protein